MLTRSPRGSCETERLDPVTYKICASLLCLVPFCATDGLLEDCALHIAGPLALMAAHGAKRLWSTACGSLPALTSPQMIPAR